MMQRLSGKVVALSALVLFLSYIGYRLYETKSDAAALQAKTLEDAVPTVAVVHPKPADASETITLPGNITAWFEAPIYAQVSGYVKMWYKDYGAQVKKGDILAEINAPALDAQYAQAKADLDSERARYALADITAKRWVALRPNQAVSEQSISVKVAEAKAEAAKVKASEQNVRNYEALIRFKTIVAPYDGVVTVRNINVGDYVNKEGGFSTPGSISNLFTVADVSMDHLIADSAAMKSLLEQIREVAHNPKSTVLMLGETGTGKEFVARVLHHNGSRASAPFIGVNCTAIPRDLFESELFGYERGAFTGAHQRKLGLLDRAEGGTLFLDEIGDLDLTMRDCLRHAIFEQYPVGKSRQTVVIGQPVDFPLRALPLTDILSGAHDGQPLQLVVEDGLGL